MMAVRRQSGAAPARGDHAQSETLREKVTAAERLAKAAAQTARAGQAAAQVRSALATLSAGDGGGDGAADDAVLQAARDALDALRDDEAVNPAVADCLALLQLALVRRGLDRPARAASRLAGLGALLLPIAPALRGVPMRPPLARALAILTAAAERAIVAPLLWRYRLRAPLRALAEELAFPATRMLPRAIPTSHFAPHDQCHFDAIQCALAIRRAVEQAALDDAVAGRFIAGTWCRILFAVARRRDYARWLPPLEHTARQAIALARALSSGPPPADVGAHIDALGARLLGGATLGGESTEEVESFVRHLRERAGLLPRRAPHPRLQRDWPVRGVRGVAPTRHRII